LRIFFSLALDGSIMTQANILEMAKQGNPQAIASLMNLSLQPKGVTAQTAINDGCLHVFLSSQQLLSQSAIVQFVQQGLAALGSNSIQQVKIYARKDGKETPDWTDAFQLSAAGAAPVPTAPPPATPPASRPKPQLKVPQFSTAPPKAAPVNAATAPTNGAIAPKATAGGAVNGAMVPGSAPRSPYPMPTHGAKRRGKPTKPVQQVKFYLRQFMYKMRTSSRYATAVGISASAFIGGGIVALIFSSHSKPSDPVGMNGAPTSNQVNPVAEVQSPELQQAQATQYLVQMNKSQQAFYQTNNRLAASLEELERSASIISRSNNYTYELTSPEQTQANITAIPRMGGLKSYISTIRFSSSASATAPATLVCSSNQPSKTPPTIAPTSDGSVQCSPDASPIASAGI
jgi:Type IV pilin-like G and H, putative